jgi:hypothetical protein
MPDEMKKEADQAQQESVKGEQTAGWSIVATLVVPILLPDDDRWPPKEWKEGPWPDLGDGTRPMSQRYQAYQGSVMASLLLDPDRRCHLVGVKDDEHSGKLFKFEAAELVRPDDRTQWGLVHLSTGNLNFASLKARANELKRYVRLQKAEPGNEYKKIANRLKPAVPVKTIGSRASVVVLLIGEPVEWDDKGDLLAGALDIVPNWPLAEGVLRSEIRNAEVGIHGILIESSSKDAKDLKWNLQGSYAEQVLIARAQRAAVEGFVTEVATLFDKTAETKADELVREFYRWRARLWWSDISTEPTATALLQSYQTMLRLPENVKQLSEEMSDYAAVAQEDAAKAAAQSSARLARTATIFTVIAVPATVGFTGAEVLGWHGVAGFFGALGVTVVGAVLISGALRGRLRRLRPPRPIPGRTARPH